MKYDFWQGQEMRTETQTETLTDRRQIQYKNVKNVKNINTLHQDVVSLFDFYKSQYSKDVSPQEPIFNWGLCEKLAKPYVKALGLERVKELVLDYLSKDNEFYKKNAWDLPTFLSAKVINILNSDVK